MGFLSPDPPKPPVISPPPKNDIGRQESKSIAKTKRKRKISNSSYNDSIKGGAVNPAYSTGTKTKQGQ